MVPTVAVAPRTAVRTAEAAITAAGGEDIVTDGGAAWPTAASDGDRTTSAATLVDVSRLGSGAQVSAAQVGPSSNAGTQQFVRGLSADANSATLPLARAMTSCSTSASDSDDDDASESESDAAQSSTARGDGNGDGDGSQASSAERNGWRSSCSQLHRSPASRRRHLSRKSRQESDTHAAAGNSGRFPPNPMSSSIAPTSSQPPVSDHGRFPVRSSTAVHPSDQTSEAGVGAPPRATSGAIHAGVPRGPRGAGSDTSLAAPKSASFVESMPLPRSTFLPLTSPCTTPATSWRYCSADATRRSTRRAARSPSPPLAASAAVPPGTSSMWRFLDAAVASSPRHAIAIAPPCLASTDFTANARPVALSTAECTVPKAPLPMHFPRVHSMTRAAQSWPAKRKAGREESCGLGRGYESCGIGGSWDRVAAFDACVAIAALGFSPPIGAPVPPRRTCSRPSHTSAKRAPQPPTW
ncbi:hypothetical protein BRADI_1g65501v3 [Brachypodium distachyon]|uniref:Uncharacterized protein n=1 Tax=Brachypodium distachyon TaxID=15368 RepID=A0A0Q3HHU6_BRADI|nr:hypothetical protein BRADI_1g65501v3 [Brachypodium distachyon]